MATATLLSTLRAHGFESLATNLARLQDEGAIAAEAQREAEFLRELAGEPDQADLLESLLTA